MCAYYIIINSLPDFRHKLKLIRSFTIHASLTNVRNVWLLNFTRVFHHVYSTVVSKVAWANFYAWDDLG